MTGTSLSQPADQPPLPQDLRNLRTQGSLPAMELPEWIASTRMSPTGLVVLPLAKANDFDYVANPPFLYLASCLLAVMSFVIFMNDPNAFAKGAGGPKSDSLVLGIPFMVLIGLTFLCQWLVYEQRKKSSPEIASLVVNPGNSGVVNQRLRPGVEMIEKVELRFRERWFDTARSPHRWQERVESITELALTPQSRSLGVVNVDIPANAEGSFDTQHYKLEWILVVTSQPRIGRPRTDEYLLWVPERSVFRSL